MGGVAKSWALRKLPQAPGDKTLAIQQPDHDPGYSNFSGVIEKGYGAGTVQLFRHGDAEVLYSRPDQIRFVTHDGEPEEYTMVKTDGPNWLLLRVFPRSIAYKNNSRMLFCQTAHDCCMTIGTVLV